MEQRKGITLVTGGLPIALGASEQGTKSPENPAPGLCVFTSGVYKGVGLMPRSN